MVKTVEPIGPKFFCGTLHDPREGLPKLEEKIPENKLDFFQNALIRKEKSAKFLKLLKGKGGVKPP